MPSSLTGPAEMVHVAYRDDPTWLVAVRCWFWFWSRFREGHLQIELGPPSSSTTPQYPAMGSRLCPHRVTAMR